MFRIISIVGIVVAVLLGLLLKARRTKAEAKASCGCPVEKLVLLAVIVGLGGAAITGLGGAIVLGGMHHWPLMLHCTFAPLFAVGIAALALLWGQRFMPDRPAVPGRALFWLMLACALWVILTAVIPMTPLFGTDGQNWLADAHRYGALILTMLAILFAGRRASIVTEPSAAPTEPAESAAVQHA